MTTATTTTEAPLEKDNAGSEASVRTTSGSATGRQIGAPDPLRDIYRLAISKAYNAARDPEIPMQLVPEYVDAAAFFGRRMGKTWDDVMTECINYSIAEMERSGEHA